MAGRICEGRSQNAPGTQGVPVIYRPAKAY